MPDPQDPATRDRSVLDWSEVEEPGKARVLRWYTACTRLRRELLGSAPTRFADVSVDVDEDARWVVLVHAPAGRPAYAVVANLAEREQAVPVAAGPGELLLAWEEDGTLVGDGVVILPPHAVAVLRLP